jgi:hypothetical protein
MRRNPHRARARRKFYELYVDGSSPSATRVEAMVPLWAIEEDTEFPMTPNWHGETVWRVIDIDLREPPTMRVRMSCRPLAPLPWHSRQYRRLPISVESDRDLPAAFSTSVQDKTTWVLPGTATSYVEATLSIVPMRSSEAAL